MNDTPPKRPSLWLWLPLALFIGFFALVMSGLLNPAQREVASTMIGKPLPAFDLRPAVAERPGLARANLADGKPRLLNVFASWCVPCVAEAPQLQALAAQGAEIDGIAIRDRSEDVARFLAANGNPYTRIGADDLSAVQLGIGSSGVPETFVIDGQGTIRHQHIGDIRVEDVPGLLAKLREAPR
ncbi:MAG TPA: redoxin family protein [Novosphingobium sp.]|nr:redoxin family protein [Novosphingobium sp.]